MSPSIKPASSLPPTARKKLLRVRPRVWAGMAVVLGLGFGARQLWHRAAPTIADHPQYLLTAEKIRITPPPSWIRSDIKAEVLRDLRFGELSVLDDWNTLSHQINDAFEFHPWIASVDGIRKSVPSALDVELTYRRPVAAVESSDSGGVAFLPIDEHAIRLPEADFTDAQRRYLPRISGIAGRPLVGDTWDDPRVKGGAKLAAALADVWQQLQLVEILCVLDAQSTQSEPRYTFEIVTTGGTRIAWGSALGMESSAGESTALEKRERLLQYATQHGKLDSIDGPARLDVRRELIVTPRTARNKVKNTAERATQTK